MMVVTRELLKLLRSPPSERENSNPLPMSSPTTVGLRSNASVAAKLKKAGTSDTAVVPKTRIVRNLIRGSKVDMMAFQKGQ
jgi:hypothetical protein